MTRAEFMALYAPLVGAITNAHGDHEGGWPGDCALCAILAQLETIKFLAGHVAWLTND